jgi:hypothetical protein
MSPMPAFGPLPAGTLTDGREIGEALLDPKRAGDAVVSLLDGLGWREALALPEPVIHGLIAMAIEDATAIQAGIEPSTLADLHASIAPLVPDLTLDELLAAYSDAYAAAPSSLLPQVMRGVAFKPDSVISRAQEWFLVVDGFVAPVTARSALTASASAFVPPLPLSTPGLQVPSVQSAGWDPADLAAVLSQMPPIGFLIPFRVDPMTTSIHEGHGGPGQSIAIKARHEPLYLPVLSPRTGVPLTIPGGWHPDGLLVHWEAHAESKFNEHGSFDQVVAVPELTSVFGWADLGYQTEKEKADGSGADSIDNAQVVASTSARDLMLMNYAAPYEGINLTHGERRAFSTVILEWHEAAWTHTSSGGGSTLHGTKCDGIDGDWILEGEYEQTTVGGVQKGTNTWVVTISEATMSGTYTYLDEATLDTGPVTVFLTGKAEGEATLTEDDGRIAMRLRDTKHTFSTRTDKGGSGSDTPAPLQLQIVFWEPGGNC